MPRRLPYQKLDITRDSILWFSGLFEGEGSLSKGVSRNPDLPQWCMRINMTDFDVMRKVHELFGGTLFEKAPKNKLHKPFLVWTTSRLQHIYALCAAMYQFMGNRRKARMEEFMLDFQTRHLRRRYGKQRVTEA